MSENNTVVIEGMSFDEDALSTLKEAGESGDWDATGPDALLRSLQEQQDRGVMYSPIHHEMRMERVRELDIEEWVSELRQ